MGNIEQNTIDKLFRDLIRVYSSSATSMIGLDSIQTAINELVVKDSNLNVEIGKLSDVVKHTQPRMFPLDNLMLIFDNKIQTLTNEKQLNKESINEILKTFKIRLESDLNALVENGIEWINNGDFIVIHSIEENIEHLIPEAKKRGIDFKILVLRQDILTTGEILNILNKNKIEYEVIPEYDLVHYIDKISKLFIGTQALTKDNYLICDPGTSNIISECHIHNIPIVLFLKTLKFSHYPAADQNIRKNSYNDEHNGVEYSFSIHSNDIIKSELINHIITEKGEITQDQISGIADKIIAEY